MQRGWVNTRSRPFTLLLGLLAASFVLSIILFPDQAFQSSLKGLKLWWEWVFPALLPFLVVTELLLGFGIIHGLGVLLEPLMRRVFRLPGIGGWAMAAGLIGGYPIGADACAKLRKREDIGRVEAERLLSLSHLCNPMLMVGVVGAGFLHSPEAGLMLALLHYTSAAAAGLLQRVFRKAPVGSLEVPVSKQGLAAAAIRGSMPVRAVRVMEQARREDGRAFGKLLGDAVTNSIQALMMVGGLMMIFSVAVKLVDLQIGAYTAGEWFIRMLPGLLEPHIGAFALSQQGSWIPAMQAACIAAALAWSGFSLHAQVLGFMNGTDMRYGSFLRFRLLHAAVAAAFTLLAWEPLGRLLQGTEAVFSPASRFGADPAAYTMGSNLREIAALWGSLTLMLGLLLAVMLLVSLVIGVLEKASASRRPS